MIDDISHWLRGSGLEIAMLISAAVLVVRAVDVAARRASRRVVAGEDAVAARTRDAIVQALRYAATFSVASVTAVLVLVRLSIPLGSLVPVATVIGMGIGFGAQRIVADLLAGFFLFAERQFGVGDTIKVSSVGSEDGIVGVVEEVSLRVTRLRRFDGDIVTVPNGELRQVSNMSRDWARLLVEVPISLVEDVDAVVARINDVGRELAGDPKWGPLILEVPEVTGVEDLTEDSLRLRVSGRTLPERHWSVARELRRRIALAAAAGPETVEGQR